MGSLVPGPYPQLLESTSVHSHYLTCVPLVSGS